MDVILPGRMTTGPFPERLPVFLKEHLDHAWRILHPEINRALPFRWKGEAAKQEQNANPIDPSTESKTIMDLFYEQLPHIRTLLIEDIKAAYDGDPAALTFAEVQLAYPGLLATASHRLAHELYTLNVPIIPRIMSEWTHSKTGVDIHPGAAIGHGFFIDHATGVVIGETSKIGNRVKLYQGVTLGAKSFPLDKAGNPIKHIKRHPTVEDHVILYAHCTILGNITIGANSIIGGNVVLMEDVPSNCLVATKHPELHIKQERS
ncbi:MAG: serine acetyltransferase [Kiritimatiellae bacterium]|nr:serine acetyltransferase [Kiritimatiellia bacterium]